MMVVLAAAPALAAATIQLHPGQGEPGDSFDITGQGFEPGDQIHLRWNGDRLGQPVKADEEGRFRATRTVPGSAQPGEHTVTARGVPSQATGSATFVVVSSPETTTTTVSETDSGSDDEDTATDDQETTTASDETTTGGSGGATSTATSGGEPATTQESEADQLDPEITAPEGADPDLGEHVARFSVTPDRGAPGESIEVEGRLRNGVDQVAIWLGNTLIGPSVPVEEDGVLQATGIVPEVAPGTYWMRLMTIDGELLGRVVFEVLEGTGSATVAASRISLGPQAFAVLAGLVSVVGLLVWWMWRKPKEDKEPQVPAGAARRGSVHREPAPHAVEGEHQAEEKLRQGPITRRRGKRSPDPVPSGENRTDGMHPGTEKVRERLLQASRPMGRNL